MNKDKAIDKLINELIQAKITSVKYIGGNRREHFLLDCIDATIRDLELIKELKEKGETK